MDTEAERDVSRLWNLPQWRPVGPQVVCPTLRAMGKRLVIPKTVFVRREAAGNGSA